MGALGLVVTGVVLVVTGDYVVTQGGTIAVALTGWVYVGLGASLLALQGIRGIRWGNHRTTRYTRVPGGGIREYPGGVVGEWGTQRDIQKHG